jgi:hypothetical protein
MRKTLTLSIVLLICYAAGQSLSGQSLGDVARDNREKQKAKTASATIKPKPKVITNESLAAAPEAQPTESEGKKIAAAPATTSSGRSAAEWRSLIVAQKNAIANQQAQIDKVNESIHFVTAGLFTNGVQYNQHQEKKLENVAVMQHQLEEQKKALADMQEAARRAGMGSAVYDP